MKLENILVYGWLYAAVIIGVISYVYMKNRKSQIYRTHSEELAES